MSGELALAALKEGVYDLRENPLDADHLTTVIAKALGRYQPEQENGS